MMLMSRAGARRTIWSLLLYSAISGLWYSLSVALSRGVVTIDTFEKAGYALWLFGPASILVYGTRYLGIYFIETAVILVLVVIAVRASRGSRTGAVVAWGIAVLAWLFFGFVTYTPAM